MSEHLATIEWSRDGQVFTDNQYARAHDWRFDGGAVVRGRSAFTTSGPMVMLGTKWPSMTSTWTQSAPAASRAATSSPRRAKSLARMDGQIRGAGMGPGDKAGRGP